MSEPTEITAKQKSLFWKSALSLVFELFVRLPLWFALLAFILYTVNAGFLGWVLFACYVPSQVIGLVLGKIVNKAIDAVGKERNEQIDASARFIDARRTN